MITRRLKNHHIYIECVYTQQLFIGINVFNSNYMDFSELHVQEPAEKEEKRRTVQNKRYVITCDPFDKDTIAAKVYGTNVFIVFDRLHQSVSTKIWTKKNFSDFI